MEFLPLEPLPFLVRPCLSFRSQFKGFPGGSVVRNLPIIKETWVWSLVMGKIPWRRKWQPTPVFLPGKFHGQKSLVGYSLLVHKRVGYDLATKQEQQSALKDILSGNCSLGTTLNKVSSPQKSNSWPFSVFLQRAYPHCTITVILYCFK